MALRIGPVGPVREAGLGSGAGLGSEAAGRAPQGAAVRPLSLPCRRCPPTLLKRVCTLLRWRRPIPNAASRRAPFILASRCGGWGRRPGPQRRRRGGGSPVGNHGTAARRRSRSYSPPLALSRFWRRSARRRGSNRRVRAAPSWRVRDARAGSNGPACQRGRESAAAAARSPLAARAESSDRRVSDPSVERARLRGRGGSGSLYPIR